MGTTGNIIERSLLSTFTPAEPPTRSGRVNYELFGVTMVPTWQLKLALSVHRRFLLYFAMSLSHWHPYLIHGSSSWKGRSDSQLLLPD